jgi:hypothetical protein
MSISFSLMSLFTWWHLTVPECYLWKSKRGSSDSRERIANSISFVYEWIPILDFVDDGTKADEVAGFHAYDTLWNSYISSWPKITRLCIFHILSLHIVRFDKVNSDSDSPSNSLQLSINTSSIVFVCWKKIQEQQRHLHHPIPRWCLYCYIFINLFQLTINLFQN